MSDFVPRTIEVQGRSIDEAIFNGLNSLGLSIDEVTITTLQQATKGVFGIGSKPCIVRLVERPANYVELREKQAAREDSAAREIAKETAAREARAAKIDRPVEKPAVKAELVREAVSVEPRQRTERQVARRDEVAAKEQTFASDRPRSDSAPRPDRGRVDKRRPDGRRGSEHRDGERRYDERATPADLTVYTPYAANVSDCEGARFVSGVLERMGLDAGLGYALSGDSLKLKIDSDAMGILIGHRGETLDALQYLTGLVVNRGEEGYKRVTLDTENYRNKREETLGRLARKLAGQVRATGKPITLEPMNPYERRVLHFALQTHPFVSTHSEGEEPNRCVVITPKFKETKETKQV